MVQGENAPHHIGSIMQKCYGVCRIKEGMSDPDITQPLVPGSTRSSFMRPSASRNNQETDDKCGWRQKLPLAGIFFLVGAGIGILVYLLVGTDYIIDHSSSSGNGTAYAAPDNVLRMTIPSVTQSGGTLDGTVSVTSTVTVPITIELAFLDANMRPIGVAPVIVQPSSSAVAVPYKAPAATKFVGAAWELPATAPSAGTVTLSAASFKTVTTAALTAGVTLARNGVIPTSGVYLMLPSEPIPAGAAVRFHVAGLLGTERVRAGGMTGPLGSLLGVATAEVATNNVASDVLTPPRVLAATAAAGGTWLSMTVPDTPAGGAGALFIELSEFSTGMAVSLETVQINGKDAWKKSTTSADLLRLPGFVFDATKAATDPAHFAKTFVMPTTGGTTAALTRGAHKDFVLIGAGA